MNAAVNPKPWPNSLQDLQQAIRRRAEEIYIRNGKIPGRDMDNWAQAEQEIRRESAPRNSQDRDRASGERQRNTSANTMSQSSDGYCPGRVRPGRIRSRSASTATRCSCKRANGKVLETTIVKSRLIFLRFPAAASCPRARLDILQRC